MKRIVALAIAVLAALAGPAVAKADSYGETLCQERPFMCLDPYHSIGDNGAYTGHDEPTVQFSSHRPGTGGKDLLYYVKLPINAPAKPKQDGTGGTWDFQRRATFWFSITMCDTESSPNFTKKCTPNSDRNARFRSADPHSPHYLGKAPGSAFMELQFYGPGWVPQFDGFGCTATKWCANMTIDSLSDQDNTGIQQNADCLNNHFLVGEEPINWAYITKSGKSLAPANPLSLSDGDGTGLSVDPTKVLLFNPGDVLRMHMHDTPAGYRVDITDMTTGQSGSMTASIANGFGHVLFQPNAKHCHVAPYAFHPMYNSAVPRGSLWGAHNTNVGASDEIGHFEYCDAIDPNTGACTDPGAGDSTLDEDDQFCLDGSNYPGAQPIIGCLLDDGDFDGVSYQKTWPGTFLKPKVDRRLHGTAFMFTPPSSNGKLLENVSFEADLPRIERGDEPGNPLPGCDATTGAHCVNPPPGAKFYPIYTLTKANGRCWFQQGGAHIPGTVNTFGGNSAKEYGTKVGFNTYADVGFKPITLAEVFHRDLHGNPCVT